MFDTEVYERALLTLHGLDRASIYEAMMFMIYALHVMHLFLMFAAVLLVILTLWIHKTPG